jgi:Rod binding domain-containing protein
MLDEISPLRDQTGPATQGDRKRIADAARQFEALLIARLLRTAREAGSEGWLGCGEDASASPALELAEEQFAQALAAQGGLGLARLIAVGLAPDSPPQKP